MNPEQTSMRGCSHSKSKRNGNSCEGCGCYYHPVRHVVGRKTPKYNDYTILDSDVYLGVLRSRALKFRKLSDSSGQTSTAQNALKLIDRLMTKFEFGELTLCRTMYLFLHLLQKQPELQCRSVSYGAVCLYLCAKLTQTRKAVPKLTRFIRYCCDTISETDFYELQSQVFDLASNGDISFMETGLFQQFLEFYMAKGVCFSTETGQDPGQMERLINLKAVQFIKSGEFLKYQQQKLAVFILYEARKTAMVAEIWNEHVENYTKMSTFSVYNIIKDLKRPLTRQFAVRNPSESTTSLRHCSSHSSILDIHSPTSTLTSVKTVRYFLSPLGGRSRQLSIESKELSTARITTYGPHRTVIHA